MGIYYFSINFVTVKTAVFAGCDVAAFAIYVLATNVLVSGAVPHVAY
jgi:hydrogenase maturation factor